MCKCKKTKYSIKEELKQTGIVLLDSFGLFICGSLFAFMMIGGGIHLNKISNQNNAAKPEVIKELKILCGTGNLKACKTLENL